MFKYLKEGRLFSILDKYIKAKQFMELLSLHINDLESNINSSLSLRFRTVYETNLKERFTFCIDWTLQNTIKSSILE